MNPIESAHQRLAEAGIAGDLLSKWQALATDIQTYPAAAVAYSGGVDSSFLAYTTHLALGENMLAITIQSPVETPAQGEQASRFAAQNGMRQIIIAYDPLQDPNFRSNPADRCYHCKTAILHIIWSYAHEHGIPVVFEGQNADDQGDYRPGQKAVAETGTLSPLAKHGLTKSEIRKLAKALDLSVWNQPSSPCLATRFPYGTPVTEQGLRQIGAGEDYLHQLGFPICRVRYHNELARIEVAPEQVELLVGRREEIVSYFKQIGFLYVALDLQGYRQGSLNEGLAR